MDFRFTPEQQRFRTEVRAFVRDAIAQTRDERRPPGDRRWSPAFTKLLAEQNWLAITWPKEYGGRELVYIEQMIFNEELALAGAPTEYHHRAIFYAGPVLMRHGAEEQRACFLPRIRAGEMSFCQLFSEPNAGSDLASLQTTAVAEGDNYIINGQKIWNSGAHLADYGILLARTDVTAPKHRGISMFFIPMDTRLSLLAIVRALRISRRRRSRRCTLFRPEPPRRCNRCRWRAGTSPIH